MIGFVFVCFDEPMKNSLRTRRVFHCSRTKTRALNYHEIIFMLRQRHATGVISPWLKNRRDNPTVRGIPSSTPLSKRLHVRTAKEIPEVDQTHAIKRGRVWFSIRPTRRHMQHVELYGTLSITIINCNVKSHNVSHNDDETTWLIFFFLYYFIALSSITCCSELVNVCACLFERPFVVFTRVRSFVFFSQRFSWDVFAIKAIEIPRLSSDIDLIDCPQINTHKNQRKKQFKGS